HSPTHTPPQEVQPSPAAPHSTLTHTHTHTHSTLTHTITHIHTRSSKGRSLTNYRHVILSVCACVCKEDFVVLFFYSLVLNALNFLDTNLQKRWRWDVWCVCVCVCVCVCWCVMLGICSCI